MLEKNFVLLFDMHDFSNLQSSVLHAYYHIQDVQQASLHVQTDNAS